MSRPLILLPAPLDDMTLQACEQHFETLRRWESDDIGGLLRTKGKHVRGIATGGHFHLDSALMERLPRLEIISSASVGYDAIDVETATQRGVVVTNAAGSLDNEVADTALGLLLMAVRSLSHSERYLRAGHWARAEFPLSRTSMAGRTMGIAGFGRIGREIARRAEAFNVDIVYHSRRPKESPYRYYPSLPEMARDVDTLMLVLPGGEATRHLVDKHVLEALGPEGVLINVGRGSVLDEQALIEALRSRTIMSAGLDVYADEPNVPAELIDMDNVVLLPHVGSATIPTRRAMGQLCVDNLLSWFTTGTPLTPVPESARLLKAPPTALR